MTKTHTHGRTKSAAKGPRGLSVHLEALGRALARQGVSLRRHQVLAVLAEATGARNAHVLEEASRAGDLDARRLVPMAPLAAPDGTPLRAWRDPDGGVIALGGAAVERFVPSPWGGLVDLDAPGAAAGAARPGGAAPAAPGRLTLHVARLATAHGDETVVAWSDDDLEERVAGIVRPLLRRFGVTDLAPDAAPREVVRRYREACEGGDEEESLSTETVDVEAPPAPTRAAGPAFPDPETRVENGRRAARAGAAVAAYAAASDAADPRSAATLLVRDLAWHAERALSEEHPGDDRSGAARELARGLELAMLERLEWHGEIGTDAFDVRVEYDRMAEAMCEPDPAPLDAAMAAYAEAAGGRAGADYADDRVAAEQDALSDVAHHLWSVGVEPRVVFAEALTALLVAPRPTCPAYFTWDGHAYAEAERLAREGAGA